MSEGNVITLTTMIDGFSLFFENGTRGRACRDFVINRERSQILGLVSGTSLEFDLFLGNSLLRLMSFSRRCRIK
ncbi:hypothetical protein Bca4012_037219 [Brassica carinata]